MFKKLKNKIQVELDKEQSSTNVSMCSSMSSSRADLTQEELNAQKNPAFDSLAALVVNDIEEEEDSEEIVQKFSPIKQANSGSNLMSLNEDNQKNRLEEHEKVLEDLLVKVEREHSQNGNKVQRKPLMNNNHLTVNSKKSHDTDQSADNLNEELKSKANELEDLRERFKELEQELREQINQNKKLETTNLNLQNTKHEANLRNNKLFNKLDEMKKQAKQTQDKLNKSKEENRALIEKNEQLKQMIEGLKENLQFEKEEKEELKNEFYKFKMSAHSKSESNKNEKLVDELNEKISKLEDQLSEKNKTIKLQNQRIHDIKKSVQKGDLFLRDDQQAGKQSQQQQQQQQQLSNGNLENGYSSRNGSSTKLDEQIVNGKHQSSGEAGKLNNNKDYATHVSDINFKYLQNVVLKFITSNDHESQKHLVKAISTLLKFSPDEEQIIKQSLESRTSWFKI